MGKLIPLIAAKKNGQAYQHPTVVYLNEANIAIHTSDSAGNALTKVVEELAGGHRTTYEVYETAMEIEAQRNPLTTDLLVKQVIGVSIAGAGTTQGAGTALTKYFNEVTTIGAAATEAVVLPAATVGKTCIVINNDAAGDAVKIFPAADEFIGGSAGYQAVDTVYSLTAALKRVHFVCLEAGKWFRAIDPGKR